MSEATITCPKCGYNNRVGAKFCRGCGSLLQQPSPPAYPPAPTVFAPAPPPAPVYTPAPAPQPDFYAYEPAQPERKQGKPESCLLTFLAWAFAALFVLLVCFALPYYLATQKLLEPEIYTQALIDQDFYNRMPDLFVEQMDHSKPATIKLENVACVNVQNFTRADWELIANVFLPPDWMQEQTESLAGQFFDFMQSDDDTLKLVITAEYLKDLLKGDDGFALYKTIIETKPECSITDLFAIGTWVSQPQSGCLAVCSPPIIQMDRNIWDIVTSFAGAIPTEYSLDNFLNMQPLEDLRPFYRLARTIQKACLILLPLAFVCLALTLISRKARSIQGVLLFWGLPMTIAGLLCIAIAMLLPVAGASLITSASEAADLYSGVEELLLDLTRDITSTAANGIGLPALALATIGGLMSAAGIGWGIVRKFVKA